ncbi:hypothetical protein JRO89_XS01G0109500 [Xanthoceras sorbifolium]|uniref:Uncharacterized protein n=1 Tax=Xanthoceras sorbifolium TaxID=99658 RepID=A0ABQ8IIT4_9ROSI|nr:hypothetical protein JRO89_XS01G0109500 [Xanthoceras sorbifolium]
MFFKAQNWNPKNQPISFLLLFCFSATGAAIAQFVWKDLWTDRYALYADTKQKFDALEARVLNLESNLGQVEG